MSQSTNKHSTNSPPGLGGAGGGTNKTETPSPATIDQPKSKGTGREIGPLVIEDIRQRIRKGILTYGEPLKAHNGRSAKIDLYQELLDAVMYLRQDLEEEDWQRTKDNLPPLDQIVWFHDGTQTWIGARTMVDSEYWLYGNTYGTIWHNGKTWDGDMETDDDYQPTHWMPLPQPPNCKGKLDC